MSDNYSESFENASNKSDQNATHSLKLSIDLMSVRNMVTSANIFATYQIQLDQKHNF